MGKLPLVLDDRPLPECSPQARAQLTFRDVRERYPLDVSGVITCDRTTRDCVVANESDPKILDPVSDSIRARPQHLAYQLADLNGEPGFLRHLTHECLARSFTRFDSAAWQRPAAARRRVTTPDEEQGAVAHGNRADSSDLGHRRSLTTAPIR